MFSWVKRKVFNLYLYFFSNMLYIQPGKKKVFSCICICFLVCYRFSRAKSRCSFFCICICFLICYIFSSRVKRKFLTCVCFLVCYIFSSRVKRNILHKRCDALLLFAHYCPLAAGRAFLFIITNKILIRAYHYWILLRITIIIINIVIIVIICVALVVIIITTISIVTIKY